MGWAFCRKNSRCFGKSKIILILKILFLTDNFPPEVNAPARRTYEHCMEWVKHGQEVKVITCAPNFPQGKLYPGYKNKIYQKENMEGIEVIRVWSYIAPNSGIMKRILDYSSYSIVAFFTSLNIKSDIIIATSPQFFTAIAGFFSAFLKRKKWVMEVRDLWPESIEAVGAIKNRSVIRNLEKIELFLYRNAAAIIVVTDSFKQKLVARGVPDRKITVIKNGILPYHFDFDRNNNSMKSSLGLENKFVVGFIGTHGLAHKLDFILRSAAKINDSDIHFLFVGDGAEKNKLIQLKEKLNLKNVTLLPAVSKDEVTSYIKSIDLSLVNLKNSSAFKKVIPSKIFENAALQKPILIGVEGESRALVEKYRAGLAFQPENETDFIQKLKSLKEDPELYKNCQKGALRLSKDFDRRKLAAEMLKVLQNLA